jgi:hypothetical protein
VGVNRYVIEHRLQVSMTARPKKQKLRKISKEKVEATKAEAQRLLDAGFIREVVYPELLANVIMVRKKMVNSRCAWILQTSTGVVQRMIFPSWELAKLLILPWAMRWWHCWTIFLDTIKYGSAKRTNRKPALSPPSALFVILECPKVFAMLDQYSVEWRRQLWRIKLVGMFCPTLTT